MFFNHLYPQITKYCKKYLKLKYILSITVITLIIFLLFDDFNLFKNDTQARENCLIVGMEGGYEPYNYLASIGEENKENLHPLNKDKNIYVGGYDVLVAKKIAKYLKKELIIKTIDWNGLIPALKTSQIDLIIAGMSSTPGRKTEIDFSNSYYQVNDKYVLVLNTQNNNDDINDILNNNQLTYIFQKGTFYETIKQNTEQIATGFVSFSDLAQQTKVNDKMYYLCEKTVADSHQQQYPNNLKIINISESSNLDQTIKKNAGQISIGLRKNNTNLKSQIDTFLNVELKITTQENFMSQVRNRQKNNNNSLWAILKNYFPIYQKGVIVTLKFAIYGTLGGFLLSLIFVFWQLLHVDKKRNSLLFYYLHKTCCKLISLYIWIFKGTPMLVQAMICFYGLKEFVFFQKANWFSAMTAAYIVIILNTAAYICEIISKSIKFLDQGQIQAAYALGMNQRKVAQFIILPQILQRTRVPINNEFIVNLKDCAVFSVLGVTELFGATQKIYSQLPNTKPFYLASFIYLFLILIFNFIVSKISSKIKR